VFEQSQEVREVGAGIATWPNAVRLLQGLGLTGRLAEIGTRVDKPSVRDKLGNLLHYMAAQSEDGAPGYYFHRAELLREITALVPPSCIQLGKRCVKAEESAHSVRLWFEDGASEEFDAVVAADGIHSVVHSAVIPASTPIYSHLAAYC